eukprot:UN27812
MRQQKRALESKVYDLQCQLEDQQRPQFEIEQKCEKLRNRLNERIKQGLSLDEDNQLSNSHQIADAQHKKNELLRKALNLKADHKVGDAFNQELQQEKKVERQRQREQETTVEERLENLNKHPLNRERSSRKNEDNDNSEKDNSKKNERGDVKKMILGEIEIEKGVGIGIEIEMIIITTIEEIVIGIVET